MQKKVKALNILFSKLLLVTTPTAGVIEFWRSML
jgi:hypothetical protein